MLSDRYKVIEVLDRRGSHFTRALANLLAHADTENTQRAYHAWRELWDECVREYDARERVAARRARSAQTTAAVEGEQS